MKGITNGKEKAEFSKAITDAENHLLQSIEEQEEALSRIERQEKLTRIDAQKILSESPEQKILLERIRDMQLRLELLRNIRMNWEPFIIDAKKRGIDLRINQFTALKQLVHFLETGEGEPLPAEVPRTFTPENALTAYTVQPTGAGKTGAFAIETALMSVTTLILVPFDNLLEQTKEDMEKVGGIPPEEVGLVGGGDKEIGKRITIATYAGHTALMKRNPQYAEFIRTQCKFVICDEVHTALGDHTQNYIAMIDASLSDKEVKAESEDLDAEEHVLSHMKDQIPVRALKQGFTATDRLAAKHVASYFPHYLGRVYHADMIETGILVPFCIVQSDGIIREGDVITDYMSQTDETAILRRERIYKKLLGKYRETLDMYSQHREKNQYPFRGMAFCTNHAECEAFATEGQEMGIRCQIVTGKEAKGKAGRILIKEAMQKIIDGEIDIIVTVEKLCTGFNFPEINAILWARVTSMAKTIQGIGRGGRAYSEYEYIKDKCWVFETNWAMDTNRKKGRVPMRIADALEEHGEDAEKICVMADKSDLNIRTNLIEEDIIREIQERFSPDEWAEMKVKQKAALCICGRKYGKTIAYVFKVNGNPTNNHMRHLAVGQAVWGDLNILKDEKIEELAPRLIREIQERFLPQEWARMKKPEKQALILAGRKYGSTIARILDIKGEPINTKKIHLAIGRAVWGDMDVLKDENIEEIALQLIKEIQERFLPEEWARMKKPEKQALILAGRKYGEGIATILGSQGNPTANTSVHLEIGRTIWENLDILKDEDSGKLKAEITEDIKRNFTAETWSQIQQGAKKTLVIAGRKYGQGIATILGVIGEPTSRHRIHLAVGRAVWGELDLLQEKVPRPDKAAIINNIKTRFSAEDWSKMRVKSRRKLVVSGRRYSCAIATFLGVKGDPAYQKVHFEVGKAVWGDLDIFIKKEIPQIKKEEVINEIKRISSKEKWCTMKKEERNSLILNGRRYGNAIATAMGLNGSPISSKQIHLLIGKIVWGDSDLFEEGGVEKMKKAQIIKEIKERFSPQEWVVMKVKEKQSLVIGGNKYGRRVATILQVDGSPSDTYSVHLVVGKAVWGEDWPKELDE